MISKKMIKMIKCCGWNVEDYNCEGDYIMLLKYSNAGEDFSMIIKSDNDYEFCDDLLKYSDNFDPDEHAATWYGSNCGEPNSLKVLLEDAEDIKENIKYLHSRCEEMYLYS